MKYLWCFLCEKCNFGVQRAPFLRWSFTWCTGPVKQSKCAQGGIQIFSVRKKSVCSGAGADWKNPNKKVKEAPRSNRQIPSVYAALNSHRFCTRGRILGTGGRSSNHGLPTGMTGKFWINFSLTNFIMFLEKLSVEYNKNMLFILKWHFPAHLNKKWSKL